MFKQTINIAVHIIIDMITQCVCPHYETSLLYVH